MRTAELPHAYPFRFADVVSAPADERFAGGRVRIRVSGNSRAAMGERWQSPLLCAEAIAQAALLLEGGTATDGRRGFLAGIQDLRVQRPPMAGETLEVEIRLAGRFGRLVRFDGRVSSDGEEVAAGSVLVREGRAVDEEGGAAGHDSEGADAP
jgi:3-hydroxymyristoyl/3-hydroxydecanoyl-(acyl carrier protein) dehydratase